MLGATIRCNRAMNRTDARSATGASEVVSPLNVLGFSDFESVPRCAEEVLARGISGEVLAAVAESLGVGLGPLAEMLGVGRRRMTRMMSERQPIPRHAAEALLRLIEHHEMAVDVFGSRHDAGDWLRRSHPMLDTLSPLEVLKSSSGAHRVKSLLVAIKYGGVV